VVKRVVERKRGKDRGRKRKKEGELGYK